MKLTKHFLAYSLSKVPIGKPPGPGLISLVVYSLQTNPPNYVSKWESDLSMTIPPETWNQIWVAVAKSLANVLVEVNFYFGT